MASAGVNGSTDTDLGVNQAGLIASGRADFPAATDRAVVLRTTSCGDSSRSFGSGFVIGPRQVLTAAHVVAGAGTVSVEIESWSTSGTVRGFDAQRDLALVEVSELPPLSLQVPLNFGVLDVGESGRIVGAATSGAMSFTVVDRTIIETDDVRSPSRSRRAGYIVEAATQKGDSGAGLYSSSGKLIGLVFATSAVRQERTFVTESSEIVSFLAELDNQAEFRCDPAESKLAKWTQP